MDFRQYEKMNVHIALKTGCLINGYVGDYIFAEDNFNGKESLIVDFPNGDCFEAYTEDIEKIEIIE